MDLTREEQRLLDSQQRKAYWRRWGSYLSERQWGTVREDYSANGTAWEYFPHDMARSRAYRWGEDGIGGICDNHQRICFSLALWNRRDPILKERLFGLTGNEGNHGEDVKEIYFYLDATPTHSYMKMLYKYPQAEFPYDQLLSENRRRTKNDPEFELMDTGIFNENRYFDVFVEYAKVSVEDVQVRITACNRGPEAASLDLLPTVWFRNTWSWGRYPGRPGLQLGPDSGAAKVIALQHAELGHRWLLAEGASTVLFTENETNFKRVFGFADCSPYCKDSFHDYLIHGQQNAVNPANIGTKATALYRCDIPAGGSTTLRLRFADADPSHADPKQWFGKVFDETFNTRIAEADEFYGKLNGGGHTEDALRVRRQALSGLLWSKQFYNYEVDVWLDGDPGQPAPPAERLKGRNHRVDPSLQCRRSVDAGQMGISLVRLLGYRVPLRGPGGD